MKKNKLEKRKKEHLIFDENERVEYLTGFRKRNLARKVKAKQNLEKKMKQEMKKIKHNHKEAFEQALVSQRNVPEVKHLVEPVTYDLPDHTVTISQIDSSDSPAPSTSFPLAAGKTQDEIEKLRKMIKEMKAKRIKALQKSNVQFEAKKLQKKSDKQKAKKMQKQYQRNLKHMKKKHKKKLNK